jgi:hypothetical protein
MADIFDQITASQPSPAVQSGGDIFDQIAAQNATQKPKGDIFDQAAAAPPAATISATKNTLPNWLQELTGDIETGSGFTLPGRILQKMGAKGLNPTGGSPVGDIIGGPFVGPPKIAHGLLSAVDAVSPQWTDEGKAAPPLEHPGKQAIRGLNEAAEGTMQAAAPLMITNPELLPTVARYAVMQKAIEAGAKKLGADPDTAEFAGNLGLLGAGIAEHAFKGPAVDESEVSPKVQDEATPVTPSGIASNAGDIFDQVSAQRPTAAGAQAATRNLDVAPMQIRGDSQPVARTTGLETSDGTIKNILNDETGSLDIDKLHEVASAEIKNEVQPFLDKTKSTLGDMFDELQHAIAPRAGAERSTLDSVFDLAGEREQHNWTLDQALQPVRNAFDKLPQDAQVDFIDRYKAGEKQATPEMQSIDDFMRKTDADTYRNVVDTQAASLGPKAQKMWAVMPEPAKQAFLQRISDFKADDTLPAGPLKELADGLLNFKENHYRVLWKELPKPLAEDGTVDESAPGKTVSNAALGKGNRPLEGGKGFMRQSTLDSMSEGLDRGGVPASYNPVRMFEQAQADSWRYITAQRMWQDAATQGARVFVKRGSALPDGFNFIDDKIGNVSFPAKSGEGNIQAGRWAMRDDYSRLLTNMLSHDLIRESAIGNGIMRVKNALTMYRLSLSPFHAFTTTVSAMASNLNRGVAGVYDAARLGDASLAAKGLKDILRTPISPIQDYKLGSDVVKFAANKDEFLKTMRGQDFVKAYPDASRLVDDLFSGGAKLGLHEDERVSAIADLRKAVAGNQYLRAIWNAPFAANEKAFQPLFSYYIPRLKVATWLRDYSYALVDREADLDTGKTTRGELARQTWDSVDNMYGQMNWDARYWNRTLKSSIQGAFRAFTWFAGNIRMVKDAGIGQVRELARSAQFIADRATGEPTTPGSTALPRIDPNFGKIVSLLALTAAGNTALQMATGNGAPKDWKDLLAARVGKNKDGSPMRVTLPAIVIKDGISAMYGGVGNYLKAKTSDLISGVLDAANNSDFRGAMIHHPEDSWWKQRYDDLRHGLGNPIGVSTYLRARDQGGGPANRVLGSIGFAPAPKEIDMSQGAISARDFVQAYSNKNIPEASLQKGQKTYDLRQQYQNGSLSLQRLNEMKTAGEISDQQLKKITADAEGNLVDNFKRLPLEKALDFWPDYSSDERWQLTPYLQKRAATIDRLDRTSTQRAALKARVGAALAEK